MPEAKGGAATGLDPTRPLTIGEITDRVKRLLEEAFPTLWVTGEVSNLSRPQSGHVYFTLKDDRAQLRAVMWRNTAARVPFDIEGGLEVICRGHLDVYAPRGSYQWVIEEIHPKGVGALELALRKLRQKLEREGLFDSDCKRPIPAFPRRIALITSPTGAAVQDFLKVLRRRWRGVQVLLVPSRVQGKGAAEEVARAIQVTNCLFHAVDVLVVTRGGGSLEDLWAFNEESVVRAISASRIPVISAVGHEMDVTLADLVADLRALTPSEAAERVVPEAEDVVAVLRAYQDRMARSLRTQTTAARMRVTAIAQQRVFRRPLDRVRELSLRLDELAVRAKRSWQMLGKDAESQMEMLAGKLESLSPLSVLARGYSLTVRHADGASVHDVGEVSVGESVITRFARGQMTSRVEQVDKMGVDESWKKRK